MIDQHINRSGLDRRSGNDRRKMISRVPPEIMHQRSGSERRALEERRAFWVKVSPWSSSYLGIHMAELYLRDF
jgi:hypothetical protein